MQNSKEVSYKTKHRPIISQMIILYALKLYSAVYQLYLNKTEKKIEKKRKGRNSKSVVTAADFIFSITSALHDSRNWKRPR